MARRRPEAHSVAFTFVHTADWQLGKPFGAIGGETAALLREARLTAVDRVAEVARRVGAQHVLVAGDVFDSASPPDGSLRTVLGLLAAHRPLTWHLLPGNHDPHTPGGVWQRLGAFGLPGNVRLHLTPSAADLATGVVLLAAPLTARATAEDPTRWMDGHQTPDGTIRIGLAHGSVQGFGSEGDAAVPIAPDRAARARLAYLALGDWHGTRRIGERTWYSGTPEPDQFPDNEPGHVLVVGIDSAGAPPRVERVATAQYHWRKTAVALSDPAGLDDLATAIEALGPASRRHLLSLTLTGVVPFKAAAELEVRLAAFESALRHLVVDRSRLRIVAAPDDLAALASPILRRVATDLQGLVDAGAPEAADARHALGLLAAAIGAAGAPPTSVDAA
jgi:hypothetical protein